MEKHKKARRAIPGLSRLANDCGVSYQTLYKAIFTDAVMSRKVEKKLRIARGSVLESVKEDAVSLVSAIDAALERMEIASGISNEKKGAKGLTNEHHLWHTSSVNR